MTRGASHTRTEKVVLRKRNVEGGNWHGSRAKTIGKGNSEMPNEANLSESDTRSAAA